MKTTRFFISIFAVAALCSCQKELYDNDKDIIGDVELLEGQILAVTPNTMDTKIAYGTASEGVYPVVWENDDKIRIFNAETPEGEEYAYKSGEETLAVFEGNPVDGNSRVAVYPSSAAEGLAEGKLTIDFSTLSNIGFHSALRGNENNLEKMPLVAKENAEEPGVFKFENLCGIVMFKFNDYQELRGMKIVSVEISSKSNYLAGTAEYDVETGALTMVDGEKSVKIAYKDGYNVANDNMNPSINDEGKSGFLFSLPVGTYAANDLTVTITDNFGRVFTRDITSDLTVQAGVAKAFPTLAFTFSYGEANCVVVEPSQSKTFDVTARYSFDKSLAASTMVKVQMKNTDGELVDFSEEGLTVETMWQIEEGGADLAGNVLSSVTLEGNQLTVTAVKAGNALVALKKDDVVLWSWHIWVVSELADQTYTQLTDAPTFNDRNLGATTSTPNFDGLGLFYQYGRKDPFVVSKTELKEITYSTEKIDGTNTSVSYTIKNPSTRVIANSKYWLLPQNDVLNAWGNTGDVIASNNENAYADLKNVSGGYKTIYDPCPYGYRVPDYSYISSLSPTYYDNSTGKYYLTSKAADSKVYFPAYGSLGRNSNTVDQSNYGYYWTTSHVDDYSAIFCYSKSNFNVTTNIAKTYAQRTQANNIRCMKISE